MTPGKENEHEFLTQPPRPRCRRCGGPLDFWHDPEAGITWICNNPIPIRSDEEHTLRWAQLSGDEVARLEKQADAIYHTLDL